MEKTTLIAKRAFVIATKLEYIEFLVVVVEFKIIEIHFKLSAKIQNKITNKTASKSKKINYQNTN